MDIAAMEDDVYFADLSKQISLLIMDDDDDDKQQQQLINHSAASLSFQGFSQPINQQQHEGQRLPRVQQVVLHKRECKGTGVFIPQSSHLARRKSNKQERYNNSTQNHNFNKHFHIPTSPFSSTK